MTKRRSWNAVVLNVTATEKWECQRALNNRGNLFVFVVGRTRYRQDKRERTSAAKLTADGWRRAFVVTNEGANEK